MENSIYIILHSQGYVRAAFTDFEELIFYTRRHSLSEETKIYKTQMNSWNDFGSAIECSEKIYEIAYNDFTHWKDTNWIEDEIP